MGRRHSKVQVLTEEASHGELFPKLKTAESMSDLQEAVGALPSRFLFQKVGSVEWPSLGVRTWWEGEQNGIIYCSAPSGPWPWSTLDQMRFLRRTWNMVLWEPSLNTTFYAAKRCVKAIQTLVDQNRQMGEPLPIYSEPVPLDQ